MVEAMMIGLSEESLKGSNGNSTSNSTTTDTDSPKFSKAYNFTIISSLPSAPDDIKVASANLTSSKEVDEKYNGVSGLKMMFVNG